MPRHMPFLLLAALAVTGLARARAPVALAKPASQHGLAQVGRLLIKADGSGGQFSVCQFEDNRQCEEWAVLRGDCLAGGLRLSGDTVHALFRCATGEAVDAVFSNGTTSSVSLALSDGRSLPLPQALSASGARYASADGRTVFWNKGRSAFLEEGGRTT